MKLGHHAYATDPGRKRRQNEDAFVVRPPLFAIADGRGVAWLPYTLVQEDLEAGRLVPAADAGWSVDLEIRLYRPRERIGRAAEAFWQAALDSLAGE